MPSVPLDRGGNQRRIRLKLLPATGSFWKRKEFSFTLIASLLVALSYLYPLIRRNLGGMTTCLFRLLTGKPCLLCGMTRSFASSARLHLSDAFRFHLLGPFFFAALLAFLALNGFALVSGLSVEFSCEKRVRRGGAWFVLGALLLAWVLKLHFFGADV